MTLKEINGCIDEMILSGVEFFDDSARVRLMELLKDAPYEWNDENIMKVFNATVEPLVDSDVIDRRNNIRDGVHVVADHSLRVATLAKACACQTDILPKGYTQESFQNTMYQAGLLHDIGKCCIAKKTLFNRLPRLEPKQFEKMKTHVFWSGYLCEKLFTHIPKIAWTAINNHHLKPAGFGYEGFIPCATRSFFDRILDTADSIEVMQSHDRTYKNMATDNTLSLADKIKSDIINEKIEPDMGIYYLTIVENLDKNKSFDANGNYDISQYSESAQRIINKHISEETYRKAGSGPERGKDK